MDLTAYRQTFQLEKSIQSLTIKIDIKNLPLFITHPPHIDDSSYWRILIAHYNDTLEMRIY